MTVTVLKTIETGLSDHHKMTVTVLKTIETGLSDHHKMTVTVFKTIETGLSDHHKMTVTVIMSYFKKKKPIKINYRSYKYFNVSQFRIDLQKHLLKSNKETMEYGDFQTIFMQVLDWHDPKKKTSSIRK